MIDPRPSLRTRLVTPRIELRPLRPNEAAMLLASQRRNAEHLRPWSPALSPSGDRRPSLTGAAEEIARWRGQWRRGEGYALYLVAKEEPVPSIVGRVTLGRVARGVFQNAYLGYWLDEKRQGEGLMTEAVREALAFSFGPLGLHRVQAAIMPSNARSLAVVERCGLRREGFALRYLQIAGRWEDHVLYAVTREEWKGATGR